MAPIVSVRDLRKRYGPIEAVAGISFDVNEGEVFGLLGPNGAGKTTTVEILEGLRRADSGSAIVAGIDVTRDPAGVKDRIGVQLQSSAFPENCLAREIVELFGIFYDRRVDARALLRSVGLEDRAGQRAEKLSGGQRQRLSIAVAMVNEPRVLFLDEPTTGLDPQARRNLWELIRSIRGRGTTVLLTTHYLEEAEVLCDRVAIMDGGRIALFFGFFFPLIFMTLFGVLNLGAFGRVNLGIADNARNADSQAFIGAFSKIDTLRVTAGTVDGELSAMQKGDRDLVLVIPSDFRIAPARPGSAVPTLTLYQNTGRPEQASVGAAILAQAIDQLSFAVTQTAPVVAVRREEVAGRNLRYVDFLTPGVLGMTIMQLGISSVAFAFVVDRQRGVIRRIMATPISRRNYLAAHVLQRLVLAVLQVLVLLAVAIVGFHVTVVGSMADLLVVAVLGVVATENAVPPVTQLVTLPQLFLSGVFFSKDAAPAFLRPIANVLPLTFLNDALRDVSTAGASLADVRGSLAGIAVWIVVSFVLAFRFFRLD